MKIEVLDEQVPHVIRALRDRIEKIGETYTSDYKTDEEIGALRSVAKSLGYTIEARTRSGGFEIKVTKN